MPKNCCCIDIICPVLIWILNFHSTCIALCVSSFFCYTLKLNLMVNNSIIDCHPKEDGVPHKGSSSSSGIFSLPPFFIFLAVVSALLIKSLDLDLLYVQISVRLLCDNSYCYYHCTNKFECEATYMEVTQNEILCFLLQVPILKTLH